MSKFNQFRSSRALSDVVYQHIRLQDPFHKVTRPRVSKATLKRRRLAKRNAVLLALAADRTGTGRGIARALSRELRRYAAGFRSVDADAPRATLLRRFLTLNAGKPLSEGTIRGALAGKSHSCCPQVPSRFPDDVQMRSALTTLRSQSFGSSRVAADQV